MSSEKSKAESDKTVNIMNIAYNVLSYSILTIFEFLAEVQWGFDNMTKTSVAQGSGGPYSK